jgi:hypothetical protein
MINRIAFLLVVAIALVSCSGEGNKKKNDPFAVSDSVKTQGILEISEDVIEGMVENISSPVEVAALIKSLNIDYSKDFITDTDFAEGMNTSFKKALGLGIYGADLGYLNMYSKTTTVLDYITTIKDLADDIRVGQFFDFSTLKSLATNSSNLDSLMYISTQSYNRMDRYLRENNRSGLSSLMVTGVWIEGLYLLTNVAKETDVEAIDEKIGEQKEIIGQLLIILNNYRNDKTYMELIKQIQDLKTSFDKVKITIIPGEPTMVEVDGILTIDQGDQQIIDINEELIQEITTKVNSIRNYIIGV